MLKRLVGTSDYPSNNRFNVVWGDTVGILNKCLMQRFSGAKSLGLQYYRSPSV